MSDLTKLQGLVIGLERRGEKSAAHEVSLAADEIERLRADNRLLQEDLDRCRAFYEAWMTARRSLEGK